MSTAIAQQKIRIRLKAFDRRMLDLSCEKIIETADNTAATAIGPNKCGANFVARNIEVGTSAPPMMPIALASCKLNPSITAPIKVE